MIFLYIICSKIIVFVLALSFYVYCIFKIVIILALGLCVYCMNLSIN
jgi:hypothetical protein